MVIPPRLDKRGNTCSLGGPRSLVVKDESWFTSHVYIGLSDNIRRYTDNIRDPGKILNDGVPCYY